MSSFLYDIKKTFLENIQQVSQVTGTGADEIALRQDVSVDFFGHIISSPVGVSACCVTTSTGIAVLAQLGCSVLTYKTIRTHEHNAHPLPNIVYVDRHEQLACEDAQTVVQAADTPPTNVTKIAIANSFGNAGPGPDFFRRDIRRAKGALRKGQVLIVSVFGVGATQKELVQDFVAAARLVADAGADVIELNCSCPNIGDGHGLLYENPEAVFALVQAIVSKIPLPVIVKLGIFKIQEQLKRILYAIARAGGRGVCGINTVPMQVLAGNKPAFGSNKRRIAGVSGAPIRNVALEFIRTAHAIIVQEQLNLVIVGVGGVTRPEHFDDLLGAGATVALSATGIMWNSQLALEWHRCSYASIQPVFAESCAGPLSMSGKIYTARPDQTSHKATSGTV